MWRGHTISALEPWCDEDIVAIKRVYHQGQVTVELHVSCHADQGESAL